MQKKINPRYSGLAVEDKIPTTILGGTKEDIITTKNLVLKDLGIKLGIIMLTLLLIRHTIDDKFAEVEKLGEYLTSFPDVTSFKGKSDEAYGFLMCTRSDADAEQQFNFDALKISIHRLLKMQSKRDVIVAVCQHTPISQYKTLEKLDIVLIPVLTINPPSTVNEKRWIDNYTKFVFWKMINWNRILVMDIDIYFLESFVDIFDDPSTQIKHTPPSSYNANDTYLGYKIRDLYPYLHAATFDNTKWELWRKVGKFNAGFYVMKPSLVHYNLLIDTAWNKSLHFAEMEQSCLNYVYNSTGAIPWTYFSEIYNYYPFNGRRNDVKAYHAKLWQKDAPRDYEPLLPLYYENYRQMKLVDTTLSIVTPLKVSYGTDSIIICCLKLSHIGIVHAVAIAFNQSSSKYPSTEQIRKSQNSFGVLTHGTHVVYIDKPISIELSGLESGTLYDIYYFATTANGNEITDRFHFEYSTRNLSLAYIIVIYILIGFATFLMYFFLFSHKILKRKAI